jgi:hypothetical protein
MSGAYGLPSDGLESSAGSRLQRRIRLLAAIAVGETLTLAVLLGNLVTADDRLVSAAVGPVHGGLYLSGVLLTWTAAFRPVTKIVALVPVAGAWLAVVQGRRRTSRPAAGS